MRQVESNRGISQWLVLDVPTQLLRTDEVHVVRLFAAVATEVVIEKVMNDLTTDESHQHEAKVQAVFDELGDGEHWKVSDEPVVQLQLTFQTHNGY